MYNQRTCLDDNQPFLSPSSARLDLSTFDCHQQFSPLHPHRKQLQLLQQHIATSPSLSHAWRRYADLESMSSWNTTTQLDVFEFTACLGAVHRQCNDNQFFLPGCSWRTPYPWLDMWRRTFQMDTMLGIPQHTTPAARAVANVPAERLLGCAPSIEWIFASSRPCRALWFFQQDHTLAQFSTLRARVQSHRSLATSVIVVCPSTHPIGLAMSAWGNHAPRQCSLVAEGSA